MRSKDLKNNPYQVYDVLVKQAHDNRYAKGERDGRNI